MGARLGFCLESFLQIITNHCSYMTLRSYADCKSYLLLETSHNKYPTPIETPRFLIRLLPIKSFPIPSHPIYANANNSLDLNLLSLGDSVWCRSNCPVANPRSTTSSTQIISNFKLIRANECTGVNFIQDRNIIHQLEFQSKIRRASYINTSK